MGSAAFSCHLVQVPCFANTPAVGAGVGSACFEYVIGFDFQCTFFIFGSTFLDFIANERMPQSQELKSDYRCGENITFRCDSSGVCKQLGIDVILLGELHIGFVIYFGSHISGCTQNAQIGICSLTGIIGIYEDDLVLLLMHHNIVWGKIGKNQSRKVYFAKCIKQIYDNLISFFKSVLLTIPSIKLAIDFGYSNVLVKRIVFSGFQHSITQLIVKQSEWKSHVLSEFLLVRLAT